MDLVKKTSHTQTKYDSTVRPSLFCFLFCNSGFSQARCVEWCEVLMLRFTAASLLCPCCKHPGAFKNILPPVWSGGLVAIKMQMLAASQTEPRHFTTCQRWRRPCSVAAAALEDLAGRFKRFPTTWARQGLLQLIDFWLFNPIQSSINLVSQLSRPGPFFRPPLSISVSRPPLSSAPYHSYTELQAFPTPTRLLLHPAFYPPHL